ncbi:hypothetical protein Tco_0038217 [Tanacetum coccineum]
MWLFRHKYLVDVNLSRYKVGLVANCSTQLCGIDVDETFITVVRQDLGVVIVLWGNRLGRLDHGLTEI